MTQTPPLTAIERLMTIAAVAALRGAGSPGYTCTYEDAAQAVLRAVAAPNSLAALRGALPHLEDNARFLRDMQAHAGKVVAAYDAVKTAKEAIARAEGRS